MSDMDPAAQLRAEVGAMRLDWLVEEREARAPAPLPIPPPELLARYERLYTGILSDVLREHRLMDQALPHHLQPLRSEQPCVAGLAFTVKSAPHTMLTGEMALRGGMLEAMGSGDFVVWDTSGAEDSTAWGGVMTAAAKARGVRGAAIDGGVRDTRQVMDAGFPVFCRFRHPNAALGRAMISHCGVSLRIGAVMVIRATSWWPTWTGWWSCRAPWRYRCWSGPRRSSGSSGRSSAGSRRATPSPRSVPKEAISDAR